MGEFVVPVTVTTTVDDVDDAYELLVAVKRASMLSLPAGRVLVVQVADEAVPPVLMATAVQPVIGVDPLKYSNSTVPAGLVLSAAETVAVKVTDVPCVTLVVPPSDSVVVVRMAFTVTTCGDDVDGAYELLVGVNLAVMVSVATGRELVVHVAVPTPGEVELPDPSRLSPQPCSP